MPLLDQGTLSDFLDTDALLRADATFIYSELGALEDAMTVSKMITGGSPAIEWEEDGDDPESGMHYRLRSLFDFLCSWRRSTIDNTLPTYIPPIPETSHCHVAFADLIAALTAFEMFTSGITGRAFNLDEKYGTYKEDRYRLDWLNDEATVPKWTRWELLSLASLTTTDYVEDGAQAMAGILAGLSETDEPMPYNMLARLVSESPEMADTWQELTDLGFDGENIATRSQVTVRAAKRLRDSGAVEVASSGKVSFWRLATTITEENKESAE